MKSNPVLSKFNEFFLDLREGRKVKVSYKAERRLIYP